MNRPARAAAGRRVPNAEEPGRGGRPFVFSPGFLLPVLCLLFVPVRGAAAKEVIDPFTMPSARFAGLGGNHAAMGDNFYSLFTNPASFVGVKEEFSAAEISISTYGPIFELIDLLHNNSGSLDDLDISGIVNSGGLALGVDIGGPLSLGWVGRGLGLGIFNRMKVSAAVSGTKIRPLVFGDVLVVGGYSFRVVEKGDHLLDMGFLGKGFFRGLLSLGASIFDAASVLDDPLGQPFNTYLGLGIDLGLRYTFRENLTLALVCFDAYSPVLATPYDSFSAFRDKKGPAGSGASYAAVKRRLDLGVKYRIRSTFLDRYLTGFTVMADYHDFLDLMEPVFRNPVLNVGLGVEIEMLHAFSLRLGVGDALPCLGLGLDLSFMTLDLAIHGKELGFDPGVQSTYALDIGLLFRY